MPTILTDPSPTRRSPRAFHPSPAAALSQKIPCTIAAINGGFDIEAAYSPELDLWYAQTQDNKNAGMTGILVYPLSVRYYNIDSLIFPFVIIGLAFFWHQFYKCRYTGNAFK